MQYMHKACPASSECVVEEQCRGHIAFFAHPKCTHNCNVVHADTS